MTRVDDLKAELELAELEARLAKAKETKTGPSRELKDQVRAARQKYREARQGD